MCPVLVPGGSAHAGDTLPVQEMLWRCSAHARDVLHMLGGYACAGDTLPMLGSSACAGKLCLWHRDAPGHALCCSPAADQADVPPHLQEFSHPVESLALTVEEMINVRRVLVKAEMEKFLQSKELYSSLRKGKVGPGAGGAKCRLPGPRLSHPSAHRSAAAAGPSSPSSPGLQLASSASGECHTMSRYAWG